MEKTCTDKRCLIIGCRRHKHRVAVTSLIVCPACEHATDLKRDMEKPVAGGLRRSTQGPSPS